MKDTVGRIWRSYKLWEAKTLYVDVKSESKFGYADMIYGYASKLQP